MTAPQSCDTFVVLPPLTKHGVVFGKNSDRPQNEVQEVVYYPAGESTNPTKCTYIEVDGTGTKKAVILSKPGWMWGAEMGANECGVAIGNEAIFASDDSYDLREKRLLGMDLVRLGLERSASASEALEVITSLLEKHGQGGPCADNDPNFTYHNSFLIADPKCCWILETCGKHWAAEYITVGHRNISNCLTITTKIDKHSDGLMEYAKSKGLWDGNEEFNFAKTFDGEGYLNHKRFQGGKTLLENLTQNGGFRETDMFKILRDKETDICRGCDDGSPTQGSQVSTLSDVHPSVHWFTATPDPSKSVFKPFVFTPNASISKHTKCPENDSSAPHTLYALHKAATNKEGNQVQELLFNMEADCVNEVDNVVADIGDDLTELDELLKDCVETEVKFYR